jgi:predicted nucleic acid-binding protein
MQTERKARLLEKHFQLLPDGLATHQEWRQLVVAHSIMGLQVYDARLVASMAVYGIDHLLTFNVRDFKRFPGIFAIHPSDAK